MSDLVHNAEQEFWRPPVAHSAANSALAEACQRCNTEFMVGAAFCHICGMGRHRSRANASSTWAKPFEFLRAFDFANIKGWFGLPLASLGAFFLGAAFLIVALSVGLMSVHDFADFEAIQLWRLQWLVAACAAFLAAILLKSRRSET